MKKRFNILNWVLGNLICMLGVAFATKADYGLSMIAAGPYVIHVCLRDTLPWFSQGMSEYMYEVLFLIILCIVIRKFELKYLLTFAEAIISGVILDLWFGLLGGNGAYAETGMRIISYISGLVLTALGVAFFFRTELPLQVYDFVVVKFAETYHLEQSKVKQAYDFLMLAISLLVSLVFTGRLTGIGIGTVITTVLNSTVIMLWGKLIDSFERKRK